MTRDDAGGRLYYGLSGGHSGRLAARSHNYQGALPGAEEVISYKMPAFRLDGRVVIYFAGYKGHIGVYPVHLALPEMAERLAPYLSGKATAKFPLDAPLPLELLADVARGLARAHAAIAAAKQRKVRA